MKPHRYLRLRHLLLKHLERRHGNMLALERDINEAAGREHAIDRRKLKDLLRSTKDVALRLSELEAFDDFLNLHGEGLAFLTLYERPALLEMLAMMKQVHFLVGARSLKKIVSVSHFDTEAYGDIGRFLNNPRPGVATELDVVLMGAPRRGARDLQVWPWERILLEAQAVVTIASPLANPATERMLELITGHRGQSSQFGGLPRPPIAFVLPEPYAKKVRSSFVERPADLPAELALEGRKICNLCWGIRVGKKLVVSEEGGTATAKDQRLSKTYGVIVAQRRANGHVWVIVAGLHGAGTHAAARAIEGAEISLASGPLGEDGPMHVRVVEALVSTTRFHGAIIGKVESQRILPEYNQSFPPSAGGPVHKTAS